MFKLLLRASNMENKALYELYFQERTHHVNTVSRYGLKKVQSPTFTNLRARYFSELNTQEAIK